MNLVIANGAMLTAGPPGAALCGWGGLRAVFAASVNGQSAAVETAELRDVWRTLQGDSEAYKRLIERHQQHVSAIMWRFTRDRGVHEELVQDVFVEAYLSLRTYKGKAPLSHWLARIATRVGYGFWKANQQGPGEAVSLADWDGVAEDGDGGMEPAEAGRLLYDLLGRLGPRDRLVLTLRYLEECDTEETSRRTGWSKAMVKVQSLRAKARLKKLAEKAGWELQL